MNYEINFEKFSETDVREEIIAPLLRRLGYRSGTDNDILRELHLVYKRQRIGRKKPKTNPPIRGVADYVCEVKDVARWVIEAKAPDVDLTEEVIEQAVSYASHPEIRAVLFVVCNGRELQLHDSRRPPLTPALLTMLYEELEDRFQELSNVLSAEALRRDHPGVIVDAAMPLCPGLRSFAVVAGGKIIYDKCALPQLSGFTVTVPDGSMMRDSDGKLLFVIETVPPFDHLKTLGDRCGFGTFEYNSSSEELSTSSTLPTRFVSKYSVVIPKGESMRNPETGEDLILPDNMFIHQAGTLNVHYEAGALLGRLSVESESKFGVKSEFHQFEGRFSCRLI